MRAQWNKTTLKKSTNDKTKHKSIDVEDKSKEQQRTNPWKETEIQSTTRNKSMEGEHKSKTTKQKSIDVEDKSKAQQRTNPQS